MGKLDPRKAFAGDDPARCLQRAAKAMLEQAMRNGDERDRRASLFQYTSTPYLEVTVEQVRHNPPLWRMRSVQPLLAEYGPVQVEEEDRNHLAAELRHVAMNALVTYGYCNTREEARQRVAAMEIREVGLIHLRDSQRHNSEWNR